MLRDYFSTSCFNHAIPPLPPSDQSLYDARELMYQKTTCVLLMRFSNYFQPWTLARRQDLTESQLTCSRLELELWHPLMNLSLQTGTIPTEWKKSLIVPVPKTSSATTPIDYRPIDLPFEYPEQSAGTPHLPYYFRPSSECVSHFRFSMGFSTRCYCTSCQSRQLVENI